jgi:hypothetical protein
MEYLMITAHLDKLCNILSKWRRQNRPLLLRETSSKTKLKSEYWNALAVSNLPHLTKPQIWSLMTASLLSLIHGFNILMEAFGIFFICITLVWRRPCLSVKRTLLLYNPGGDNYQSNFPQVLCTSYFHSDQASPALPTEKPTKHSLPEE